MTVTVTISGMNCGHCVRAVTEALSAVPDVTDLHVEVGRATFRSASGPDHAALAAAIDDAGFAIGGVTTGP